MPLVKLTFKAEPVQVTDDEAQSLRGQGLLEKVLDAKPAVPKPADPPSGESKEQK